MVRLRDAKHAGIILARDAVERLAIGNRMLDIAG